MHESNKCGRCIKCSSKITKMKIILISTGSKNDIGPQAISKFLEKHNHKTEIIFYNKKELNKILNKCKATGLIVVSANVATHKIASEIFKRLKSINKPLAYAGIYPSLYPTEAIKETDLIILKNPKETILELANRLENFQRINDIEGLWFKASREEIIKNA